MGWRSAQGAGQLTLRTAQQRPKPSNHKALESVAATPKCLTEECMHYCPMEVPQGTRGGPQGTRAGPHKNVLLFYTGCTFIDVPTPLHWSHLSSCCPCCDQGPVGLLPTGYGLARCLLVSIWYLGQAPNHLRTVHRSGACTIRSGKSYRYGFEPRTLGSSELHFDYSAPS